MRDEFSLEQQLEAMLTVALEPISPEELADVVDVDAEAVVATLRLLRAEFQRERRGFQLVELASGWVMQSAPEVAPWVQRTLSARISNPGMELDSASSLSIRLRTF